MSKSESVASYHQTVVCVPLLLSVMSTTQVFFSFLNYDCNKIEDDSCVVNGYGYGFLFTDLTRRKGTIVEAIPSMVSTMMLGSR